MTRDEMMARMSYAEFQEWKILEQIEPFGEVGDYFRAGIITANLLNVHLRQGAEPFKPSDFIPKIEQEPEPQTPEQMLAFMMMLKETQDARLANA